MKKISVVGTGIWGTALALTAARAGNQVLCQARKAEIVKEINLKHINKTYLPDVPLPDTIKATAYMQEALEFSDMILLTVSAQHTRTTLQQMKPFISEKSIIVMCAKGIEAGSGKLLSEIAAEEIPAATTAILSGPGFAVDVANRKLTSVTLACAKPDIAAKLAGQLGTSFFRPYLTSDIISPQIGGSVKNVIAIASGVAEGAGFGDGARAALITRGLNEMARLSKALGGTLPTMMGMSGLGDLVLTASCPQSRNFSFGYEVGAAGQAKKVLAENTRTVEGIHSAKAVIKRAREAGVEMPICEMISKVLFENLALDKAIEELMSRPYKEEGFY